MDENVYVPIKKNANKKKKGTQYSSPKRKPNEKEERKMLRKVIEIMIVSGMKNHVYKFQNQIRLQMKGGPIGLALTGEVADCCMIDWDRKFIKKLKELNLAVPLYSRFKDDMLLVAKAVENGVKFEDGKLVIDAEKKKSDETKNVHEVTMGLMQKIRESLDPTIKLTVDTPMNHENGKMPVLDISVKINEKENNRVDFEFLEKPTKNPRVLLASSALNESSKRTILTQECLRIIRNTKKELGIEVRNTHLNKFMLKLKNSGYNQKYRKQILDSALKAYVKMVEDDISGKKPLYRSRDWDFDKIMALIGGKIQNPK